MMCPVVRREEVTKFRDMEAMELTTYIYKVFWEAKEYSES